MGAVRSFELAERIEQEMERIERSLDFLRSLLLEDEKVVLNIQITADRITVTDQMKVLISDNS